MILALVVGVLLSGRFRDRNQWMCSCYPLGCSSCCSRCRWSLGAKLNLTLDWGLVWSRGVLRREGRVIDIRKIGLCFRAQRYLYSKTSSATCNSAPSKDSACVKNPLKRVKIFMSSKHSSTRVSSYLQFFWTMNWMKGYIMFQISQTASKSGCCFTNHGKFTINCWMKE